MNKEDFLQQLDEYLMGNVSETERIDSMRYYKEYIQEELRAGKKEEEILDSLGSPYGIAKSIIEAKGYDMNERKDYEEYDRGDSADAGYEQGSSSYSHRQIEIRGWKAWLMKAGIILILFLILALIFKIFVVLLPFILGLIIVITVIKFFNNRS